MKIIVTGGSGFIGTNIVQYYLDKKYKVFNFDINQPQNKKHKKYWYKVNITNYKVVSKLIKIIQPTYIIHLAARTDLSGKKYKDYIVNIKGVSNIIKICKNYKNIKRVIFASTMLVKRLDTKTNSILDYDPNTNYGKSKVEGENMVLNHKSISAEMCIIRPTSIWGEWFREPYKNFFDYVIKGRYFHPGRNSCKKTFGYVGNTVYQIDKLLFADAKKIKNKIFYIGDKPSVNISKWANEIAILAKVSKPKKMPFFIFKLLGWLGDFIVKLGIKFPMTTFRLKNMTTDRVCKLNDTYDICGNPPYDRKKATIKTLEWIYQMNK